MSNRYPLEGLHAVITGGGSGIGAAIAQALIADGARVTLMGRRIEKLEEQRDRLNVDGGPSVELQVCDVGDEASVRQAFAAAVAAAGPIDLLVNNAGQVETAPLAKTSLDTWQRLLNVNLTGSFLCSREVLPAMTERRFGRIVNVASTAALKGYAYVAAYCAAKHGVLGLTRALALETARKGVTVNAVCPGYTPRPTSSPARSTPSSPRPAARRTRRAPSSPRSIPRDGWSTRRKSPPRWPGWRVATAAPSRGRRSRSPAGR